MNEEQNIANKEILHSFNFVGNAQYVIEELNRIGIECAILDTNDNQTDVYVKKSDWETAKKILNGMELEEEMPNNSDYIGKSYLEDFNEYNDKMYDPGHYTGGKMPFYMMDKKTWKFIIPVYLTVGVLLLYISYKTGEWPDLEGWIWITAYLFAGFGMLWQLIKSNKR